jgi:hypothetical protein
MLGFVGEDECRISAPFQAKKKERTMIEILDKKIKYLFIALGKVQPPSLVKYL